MDNWEDDEFVPPPPSKEPPKSMWDDEDVEDEDVKDSWEDDDTTQALGTSSVFQENHRYSRSSEFHITQGKIKNDAVPLALFIK